MSDGFSVHSALHDYSVLFTDDYLRELTKLLRPDDVILLDERVLESREAKLGPVLTSQPHFLILSSEDLKEYHQVGRIIEFLIESGFRKNHRLIAIGGGIVQDITAFISSIMYRGVDWLFIPTTLLAQCDSCIGGKSSINFGKYKNQIGNFNPPAEIFIDLHFLDTLPAGDIRSGLGEMMHFYFLSSQSDFDFITSHYDQALLERSVLQQLIRRSLEIKKRVVEIDEFDQNERLLFNYGHSFGHAIESLTNYAVPHGIAVNIGMGLSNWISLHLGHITQAQYDEMHLPIVKNVGHVDLGAIDLAEYEDALRKDKKNIGSQINVILTRGIGAMFKSPLEMNDATRGWIGDYFQNMQQWSEQQ